MTEEETLAKRNMSTSEVSKYWCSKIPGLMYKAPVLEHEVVSLEKKEN